MSLIKSLKSKILETKNDLSDSLPTNILGKNISESNDFGFDILFRYKFNWTKIHKESEQLSKNIQKSEVIFLKICATTKEMHDRLNQLHSQLSDLTQISTQINTIHSIIDSISTTCGAVEKSLIELEDANEEMDFKSQKEQHNTQLQAFTQHKQQQLKQANSRLDCKLKQSVKMKEIRDAAKLAERQQVFADAHNQLMQDFKNTGFIDKRETTDTVIVDISEITIDNDSQELESFLQDNISPKT